MEYKRKYCKLPHVKKRQKVNSHNWHVKNKDERRESIKEWRYSNPERSQQYNKDRRHKNHKISKKEWESCKSYFNNQCAYCGMTLEEHKKEIGQDLHKEHYIHNGENDLSNCIPSCKICNSEKWEFPPDRWYDKDNPKFLEDRQDKINKWLNDDYKNFIKQTKLN